MFGDCGAVINYFVFLIIIAAQMNKYKEKIKVKVGLICAHPLPWFGEGLHFLHEILMIWEILNQAKQK